MTHQETDTIIALSSGQGRSGIAVVRISGPKSDKILKKLTHFRLPAPRKAATRWLHDSYGVRFDEALVLRFSAPNSFTGEDCAEIHCHGSPAIVEAILIQATRLKKVRLAERGEFSRRAFENGKLDLLQAEGIADLIDANSIAQMKQAARFVGGDASERIETWRKIILEASAFLAASIDFSDEGDVGEDAHAPVVGLIDELVSEFNAALADAKSASRIRDGLRIAILGKPNAGKSTLINALAKRDAAIVSDIPGTTRDVLETHIVLNGVPVTVADTAGLRLTDDPIESEGVKRARRWAEDADIRIYLTRADDEVGNRPAELRPNDIWVISQADRADGELFPNEVDLSLAVATGQGMDTLESILLQKVVGLTSSDEAPTVVRLRHIESLNESLAALERAKALLMEIGDVDFAAFELSIARTSLDQILGHVDVEDILGEVFSGFCVGK